MIPSAQRFKALTFGFLLGASVLTLGATTASAVDPADLPTAGNVTSGAASLSYSGSTLDIDQRTDRAIIEWGTFNIGQSATVNFTQPRSTSLAVNKIVGRGADPTEILGALNSNGRVMVLDPNGVIFGSRSRVDVGGIIVSTGTVDEALIMNGGDIVIGDIDIKDSGISIERGSTITASRAGLVALVAPSVVNDGTITANLGRVQIGAGSNATIDFYGDGLMELSLDDGLAQELVNTGSIFADGGSIQIEAAAARNIVDNLIQNTGIIQASTARGGTKSGSIYMLAAGSSADDENFRATIQNDGTIDTSSSADSSNSGDITIQANNIDLGIGSEILAHGVKSGGEIVLKTQDGDIASRGRNTIHTSDANIDLSANNIDLTGVRFFNGDTGVTNLSANGDINVSTDVSINLGQVDAQSVTMQTTDENAHIILNDTITTTDSGNSLTLASAGNFINNAGADALDTGDGRWLVYSADPSDNRLGGLSSDFKRYNRTYADNAPGTITENGNGLLYSISPTLRVSANNITREYGDANPALTYSVSGLIDGDTFASATDGEASLSAAGASQNVGTSTIDAAVGTLSSDLGYTLEFIDGTLTVNKADLRVDINDASRTVGQDNPTFDATITGFKLTDTIGDLDTVPVYTTAADTRSAAGTYSIDGSRGIDSNYNFVYRSGTLNVASKAVRTSEVPVTESVRHISNLPESIGNKLGPKAKKIKEIQNMNCLVATPKFGCVLQ